MLNHSNIHYFQIVIFGALTFIYIIAELLDLARVEIRTFSLMIGDEIFVLFLIF